LVVVRALLQFVETREGTALRGAHGRRATAEEERDRYVRGDGRTAEEE